MSLSVQNCTRISKAISGLALFGLVCISGKSNSCGGPVNQGHIGNQTPISIIINNPQTLKLPSSNPVSYKQINVGPIKASVLEVDLNNPTIVVKPAIAKDRIGQIETIASMVKRNNAIAGVNAGFYDYTATNLPIGFVMIDGQVVASNMDSWNRALFTIDENNQARIYRPNDHPKVQIGFEGRKSIAIYGVNRPRYSNSIIIFTPYYGKSTRTNNFGSEIVVIGDQIARINKNQGNSEIPENGYVISLQGNADSIVDGLQVNQKVSLTTNLPKDIKHVILAGPQIVKDGQVNITLKEEKFCPGSGVYYSNHRMAVGITKENKLIFVRARSPKAITFNQAAKILLNHGAVNAMAFDGGGSSSLVYKGNGVSNRAVSNGILIWKKDS